MSDWGVIARAVHDVSYASPHKRKRWCFEPLKAWANPSAAFQLERVGFAVSSPSARKRIRVYRQVTLK